MVRSLTITSRDGEHLTVRTTTPVVPMPVTFDVLLRSGWCWMQSSMYVVGMAASPLDNRTRYAHLEGVPYRRGRLLRPIMRRIVGRDVDGIVGTVARRSAS
jgi:hypothetical protein